MVEGETPIKAVETIFETLKDLRCFADETQDIDLMQLVQVAENEASLEVLKFDSRRQNADYRAIMEIVLEELDSSQP